MVAIGKEIIKRVTGTHAPVETTLHILQSFGKENDREFVKAFDPDDPKLENHHQHILVYYPKYEDFYRNHKEEFANRATESIERILGRKLTSEERQKLRRAFELAVEYGKRFHDIFRGIDENRYHMVAESAKVHRTEGFKAIEYAEKTLGVDLLEKVGDIILELNKLFPEFSKPEEVYGDRWYEFLKKRGVKPEELKPQKEKHPTTLKVVSSSLTAEKVEVLSILQALEFADYSEKAREKALQKLSDRIAELSEEDPTPENLQKLGLYSYALEIIKAKRWEKIEKLREL
ncbi:hypothetical protein A3L11_10440 [Thermococcus siculi]|uniref:Uncharacterized protein n=1 Tax=Thermococcus siculi TaxID=72803 RepID=A0A2Z2MSH5_9EURY|nr:hypothetical protein [Thermococcus siculi]ASJ09627.1 hypothetical protein A3L11_10440 [Thermococcus siculi]